MRGFAPVGKTISCTPFNFSWSSGALVSSSWKESSRGPGNVQIDWGPLFGGAASDSGFNILCRVPPGGSIHAIRYEEPLD